MEKESKCENCPDNAGFYCIASTEKHDECLREEQRKDIEDAEAIK